PSLLLLSTLVLRLSSPLLPVPPTLLPYTTLFRSPSRPSSQVSSLLPPPPRLSLSNLLDTATSQVNRAVATPPQQNQPQRRGGDRDRKSTRLNSSHVKISYDLFCLKKKKRC